MTIEDKTLPNCPNCGSSVVITTSRDCSVLSTYIRCESCEGTYFYTESEAFGETTTDLVGISDSYICIKKYISWASKSGIKGYRCNGEWD